MRYAFDVDCWLNRWVKRTKSVTDGNAGDATRHKRRMARRGGCGAPFRIRYASVVGHGSGQLVWIISFYF